MRKLLTSILSEKELKKLRAKGFIERNAIIQKRLGEIQRKKQRIN